MISLGLDSGSSMTKAVLLEDTKIIDTKMIPTSISPRKSLEALYREIKKQHKEIDVIVTTGYGRNLLDQADFKITEITCHAAGAFFMNPDCDTIIDIGGQDSKVITIDDLGCVTDFLMNDKCAAGTGRFLDVIAKVLEVDLNDLEKLDEQSKVDVAISSTCTVFAESEVISQLARGTKIEDIVKGIHTAIASRVGSLAKRVGIKDQVVMTGGVALNQGMVRALEKNIGFKIHTSEYCQLNGAIGAALFAYQKCLQAEK